MILTAYADFRFSIFIDHGGLKKASSPLALKSHAREPLTTGRVDAKQEQVQGLC